MGFHVDSSGNIWSGANVGNTFSSASPEFYVSASGLLHSEAGDIGGITIDTGGLQANYSDINDTGFKITSGGDAFFNSIDLRVPSGASDPPSDGTEFLSIGSGKIYEFNSDLILDASGTGNDVVVKTGDRFRLSGVGSDPTMLFDGAQGNIELDLDQVTDSTTSSGRSYTSEALGYVNELTFKNQDVDIFRINAQNSDVYFYGEVQIAGDFIPSNLKAYNGFGSSGQTLQRTSNGLEWVNTSGSHADSDHTSFANSSHDHDISDINNHSHSGFVNHVDTSSGGSGGTDALSIASDGGIRINFGSTGTRVAVGNHDHDGDYSTGSHLQLASSGGTNGTSTTASRSNHTHGLATHTHTSVLSFSANEINIYGSVKPSSNNNRTIGTSSSLRFADMYSQEFYGQYFYGTLINSSSENVKTNIADTGLGLDFIEALPIKQFNYITEGHSDKKYTGVIAEDVQDILDANGWDDYYLVVDNSDTYRFNNRCQHPAICSCGDEDCEEGNYSCQDDCCSSYFKYVEEDGTVTNWVHHTVEECEAFEVDGNRHPHFNYYQLVGPLVKAVQELSTQISDLTARVEVLEG
jgi:hypothetical protein